MCFFFFFFQAEDGIRDGTVTGVQTCALPICAAWLEEDRERGGELRSHVGGREVLELAVERRAEPVAEAVARREQGVAAEAGAAPGAGGDLERRSGVEREPPDDPGIADE